MSSGALPGFRDFYPAEFAERSYITEVWREVARRHGLVEYDGPPLEPLELYTRKSGEEIVGQLYHFMDKGGREVALRPEMTPTLARMVGARANALRKPIRWFSIPQLFRYERQQRGRLREHFQLNVDIVGEPDVTADAELLAVAIDIMRAFGLTERDVRARISDRGLLSALLLDSGVPEGNLGVVYAAIDKMEREPQAELVKRLAPVGVDRETAARIFTMVSESDLSSLRTTFGDRAAVREHLERFERYLTYLDALGVREWTRFDLSIVRGLAYYTGIVFELFDVKGELRAICGGGRYDALLQSLGGIDLPALGFGMGDVVLGDVIRGRGLMPTGAPALDYWVASAEDDQLTAVMSAAAQLRRRGRRVEYALRPQALGRQLKSAAAAGADRVVILTPETTQTGIVRVKTLADGREDELSFADLLERA